MRNEMHFVKISRFYILLIDTVGSRVSILYISETSKTAMATLRHLSRTEG